MAKGGAEIDLCEMGVRFRPYRLTRRAQPCPARLLQIRRLLVLEAGVLVGEVVVGLCLGRVILVRPLGSSEQQGVSARHVGDPFPLRAQPHWCAQFPHVRQLTGLRSLHSLQKAREDSTATQQCE